MGVERSYFHRLPNEQGLLDVLHTIQFLMLQYCESNLPTFLVSQSFEPRRNQTLCCDISCTL